MELKTQIKINGSLDKVWNVFTDFKAYPEWNPFVKRLSGNVKKGEQIEVDLPGMKFKPNVLNFEPNSEFRWKGKLFFKGLFDGEHYFRLEENEDGSVTFIHGENFSGILVGLFKRKLMTETKSGFVEMNEALKKRVEEIHA